MEAVREWVTGLQEQADTLVAAAGLGTDAWLSLVAGQIAPALGAEFIATAAADMPNQPRQGELDYLVGWPDGVDGPATVQALLDEYPATFAGVTASQVSFIIASPSWTHQFAAYMRDTVNLVSRMPDTAFSEMQAATR